MKRKRVIALLLAACTVAVPVISVNAGEATWTNDDSAVITILESGDASVDVDNPVIQEIEKQTNTNIDMIYTARADEATKRNALITAGDMPDLLSVENLAVAKEMKEKGLLADLTDVLNAVYPEIFEMYGEELAKVPINNDGIYMIPNMNLGYPMNLTIRIDWLENLGLEMPTDLESFAAVAHAFTYDDPDQNGVDDTYGVNGSLTHLQSDFDAIFGAYGIPAGKNIELSDGTITTWVKHEYFLDAMKYIKGLIDDGVVTPDYMSIPSMTAWEELWNGKCGILDMVAGASAANWLGRFTEDPKPVYEDALLTGPYGDSGSAKVYVDYTKGAVVSADCENLEGVARIIKLFQSLEGNNLLNLGVEGLMFQWIDKEAGTYERLGDYTDDALHRQHGAHILYEMLMGSETSEMFVWPEAAQQQTIRAHEQAIEWPYIIESSEVYQEYGSEMTQVISEMWAELLQTDVEDMQAVYEDYIAEWEAVGGSDWEVEMTQLWKEQNQ